MGVALGGAVVYSSGMKKLTAIEKLVQSMLKAQARRALAVALFEKHDNLAEVGRQMKVSRQRAAVMVKQGLAERVK